MKTAIIVDSTTNLFPKAQGHPDVFVIPLRVNFPDGSWAYDSNDPETVRELYDSLKDMEGVPTTSQPAVGEYMALMEEIISQGYERVFALHLAAVLSGTYQTANQVLNDYEDRLEVHRVDLRSAAAVIGYCVDHMLELIEAGKDSQSIMEAAQWICKHSEIYGVVGDLSHLVKGGRLSATGAFLGNVLQMKPLLAVTPEGRIQLQEKVRSRKKVFQRLVQIASELSQSLPHGMEIFLANTNADEDLARLHDLLKEALSGCTIHLGGLGSVIGVHLGPGSYAMLCLAKPQA